MSTVRALELVLYSYEYSEACEGKSHEYGTHTRTRTILNIITHTYTHSSRPYEYVLVRYILKGLKVEICPYFDLYIMGKSETYKEIRK